MTFNLKNDHVKNWDIQRPNEKPLFNIENEDDDQDIYISERSSLASSSDFNQIHHSVEKSVPTTKTTSTIIPVPQKPPHTLRYPYNELPENGIPIAKQYKLQCKEEKMKKNSIRKAQPGQGKLGPVLESKPPELGDNPYPYWYYYKVKNPEWVMGHRRAADSQVMPFESFDLSQCAHQPALTTTTLKPRPQPPPPPPQRKPRQTNGPLKPPNSDRVRFEVSENNSQVSSRVTAHENYEINNRKHRASPKQHVPLKDLDHDDHHAQLNKRTTIPQRRKLKTEVEWTENYLQTLPHGKPVQDISNPTATSNSINHRTKKRSQLSDKTSITSDMDENGRQRQRHQQHHYHQHHSLSPARNTPSIPSQATLHHLHHHQQQQHYSPSPLCHIRRRPPSGTHIPAEFHVVDMTFKKPEPPSYLQYTRDLPFHSVSISNQTPHLPLIMREPHHPQQQQRFKTNTPRFPSDYYGTLARQTRINEWEEPLEIPKIYKPDSQAHLYDHYLHSVVDKRLVA